MTVGSPSQFSPLLGIEEENEEDLEEEGDAVSKEVEEGEILENKVDDEMEKKAQTTHRGKRSGNVSHKSSRTRAVRAKDLNFGVSQIPSKRSSGRKL